MTRWIAKDVSNSKVSSRTMLCTRLFEGLAAAAFDSLMVIKDVVRASGEKCL